MWKKRSFRFILQNLCEIPSLLIFDTIGLHGRNTGCGVAEKNIGKLQKLNVNIHGLRLVINVITLWIQCGDVDTKSTWNTPKFQEKAGETPPIHGIFMNVAKSRAHKGYDVSARADNDCERSGNWTNWSAAIQTGEILDQLLVSWWFGLVVWDFRGARVPLSPLSNNPFHRTIPGIQTTYPNHRFTISWLDLQRKKTNPLSLFYPAAKKHVLNTFNWATFCCGWIIIFHNISPTSNVLNLRGPFDFRAWFHSNFFQFHEILHRLAVLS